MQLIKKVFIDRFFYAVALIAFLLLFPSFIEFRSEVQVSFKQSGPADNFTVYYKFLKEDNYNEEWTVNQLVGHNENMVVITIPAYRPIYAIRLDPAGVIGKFTIDDLQITGASRQNIKYKQVKDALSNDINNLSKTKDGFSFSVTDLDPYFSFEGLNLEPLQKTEIFLDKLFWSLLLLFGGALGLEKFFLYARDEGLSIPKTIFLLFIFFIISTSLLFSENKYSHEFENRTLARFPNLYKEEKINSAFISDFENWINDQFGYRDIVTKIPMFINGRVFDIIPIDRDAIKGMDDYWFVTHLKTIDDVQGTNQMTDEEIATAVAPYLNIRDQLALHDIPLVVLIGPNKQVIYPEKYPTTVVRHNAPTASDQVINTLRANGVTVIFPTQNLLKHRSEDLLFLKSDTHMSQLGQYYFSQEILQTLKEIDPNIKIKPLSDFEIGRLADEEVIFDLERFAVRYNYGKELFPTLTDQDPGLVTISYLPIDPPFIINHVKYNNPDGNGSVFVLGDSFFSSIAQEMFAYSYENTEFMFVSGYAPHLQTVIEAKPDLVIMERVERAMDEIPE